MSKAHQNNKYRTLRGAVIWLYDFKCFNCLCFSFSLHAHHLNHVNTDNRIENLVPLCKSCHKLFHRIPKQPERTKKQILVLLLNKIANFNHQITLR